MLGIGGVSRYLGYAAFAIAVGLMTLFIGLKLPGGLQLSVAIRPGSGLTTSEFSPVEHFQLAMIIFNGLVFAWIASRDRLRQPLCIAIASMFLLFLIRELDFFLDNYAVDNLWQVLAAVVTAVSGVYVFRHRARLQLGWHRSWPSTGLSILITGLLILIPFTQLLSNEALWEMMLGDLYAGSAKLAVEEILELAAYVVITIGSLEFLYGWSRLPKTRSINRPRRKRRHRNR
jgi:hypothetical protein